MKNKTAILLAAGIMIFPQVVQAEEVTSNNTNSAACSKVESFPPPKNPDKSSHAPISILDFINVQFPSSITKETNVDISFSIKNNGNIGAKNIVIRAISQDIQGLVPKSVSQVNAKYYAPNQEEKYKFSFKITDNAETKNYPVVLSLAYTDENSGELHESQQTVTIKVKGSSDLEGKASSPSMDIPSGGGGSFSGGGGSFSSGGASGGMDFGPSLPVTPPSGDSAPTSSQGANVPKVIIDEYSFDPSTVQSGTPFTLNLRIFNTNRKKTIKNIRVSLTADSAESLPTGGEQGSAAAFTQAPGGASAFTPIGASNTFHIETIKPRQHASKDITLTTAPDLAPKAYTVTANFEYEDSEGNPYQSSEIIGIPVVQKSEVSFGDIDLEEEGASVGMPIPLSLEFFNTGKSPLTNVMVKFRGNYESDTSTYYVGTLAPGASDSYDANITAEKAGKQKGEIVITYDDAAGVKQEIIKPFTLDIEEEMAVSEEELQASAQTGPSWALPLGIGGVVVLLTGLAVFLWRKKKNKKNGEDLQL